MGLDHWVYHCLHIISIENWEFSGKYSKTNKHPKYLFLKILHSTCAKQVISLGVCPVDRPVVLCAGSPSEELLHAVKQTVVSV